MVHICHAWCLPVWSFVKNCVCVESQLSCRLSFFWSLLHLSRHTENLFTRYLKTTSDKKIRKEDDSPFVISWSEGQQQLLEWGVLFFFFFLQGVHPIMHCRACWVCAFCEPHLHWIALWNKRIDTNRKGLAGAKTEEDRRKKRRKKKKVSQGQKQAHSCRKRTTHTGE